MKTNSIYVQTVQIAEGTFRHISLSYTSPHTYYMTCADIFISKTNSFLGAQSWLHKYHMCSENIVACGILFALFESLKVYEKQITNRLCLFYCTLNVYQILKHNQLRLTRQMRYAHLPYRMVCLFCFSK